MNITIASSAFENGATIPRKYGYKHDNINPPLSIHGDIPDSAKSIALIMDDPDAVGAVGKIWNHWLVWNIDPNTVHIAEDTSPAGCAEGKTDFGKIGYGGPAPPDKAHTYIFRLYLLDQMLLDCDAGSDRKKLDNAMAGHIIYKTILTGRYAPQ